MQNSMTCPLRFLIAVGPSVLIRIHFPTSTHANMGINVSPFVQPSVMQMSSRVDALEASIQDIINGDISTQSNPPTPGPTSTSTPLPPKRTGSFQ